MLRRDAAGDGQGHGQGQGDDAHGNAGEHIAAQTLHGVGLRDTRLPEGTGEPQRREVGALGHVVARVMLME